MRFYKVPFELESATVGKSRIFRCSTSTEFRFLLSEFATVTATCIVTVTVTSVAAAVVPVTDLRYVMREMMDEV